MANANLTMGINGVDKTAAAFNSVKARAKATGAQIRSIMGGAIAAGLAKGKLIQSSNTICHPCGNPGSEWQAPRLERSIVRLVLTFSSFFPLIAKFTDTINKVMITLLL